MKGALIFIACLLVLCALIGSNMQVLGTRSVSAAPNGWSAHPTFRIRQPFANAPAGLSPTQIRVAYNLPSTGGQRTIAIVDAFDDPTALNDLNVFSTQFGLPAANFEKHMMSSQIPVDGGWALEISLDVQWAHAIAPNAKILLVEATSNRDTDLLAAIDYARSRSDVIAVSMSWGGPEFSGEASYDSYFTSPYGAAFFASSGDSGEGVLWPAVSANVIGVGGTTLTFTGSGAFSSETAWSGSGGGISAYVSEPGYQVAYGVPGANGKRCVPDVSYDADPGSGVSVYDSTPHSGLTGWWVVGGTSAGAPQWAAIQSLGSSASNNNFYTDAASANYSSYFRDITSGSNGYSAKTGYDLVTGLGSPLTTNFVPAKSRILFADGFESGSFSAWTGTSVTSGETATVVSSMAHHGANSSMFASNGGGGTERAFCFKTMSSVTELYARGYFYVSASGIVANDNRFYFMIFKAGSNPVAFAGWRMTGGVVRWSLLIRNGTGWGTAYSVNGSSLNQWYCVELHWKEDATSGIGELYVNGALACSISGKNTAYYGDVNRVDFGLAEITNCGATTAYGDCAVIATGYIGPEQGPLIFEDGFESGSFSVWTGVSVTSGETATVVNTLAHHGTYSGRLMSNGNFRTERACCYESVASQAELYARGYFRVAASGIAANDNRFFVMIFKAGGNPVAFAGWRMTGGVVKWCLLIRSGTGWATAYSAASPALNQWYCVELHWKKDTAAGLGEMYVDGALACSITGKNTTAYGNADRLEFGLPEIVNCANTTAYCDCVKVATAYLGPEP